VTTVLVDQGADHDAGYYPSIGVRPNGNPVLAWQFRALDSDGGSGLRLGDCSSPTCAGDVRITTVDFRPGEITGTDTDLVVGADGAVYVAYYDVTTSSLRLARCSPESCAGPAELEVFGSGFEALF